MTLYEKFKMSDNFNKFHQNHCVFWAGIRGLSTTLFQVFCSIVNFVWFVLFTLFVAVRDCTANNYATHDACIMLVLHNFKVIRPTTAGDVFLQSVALKGGIHLITRDKFSVTQSVAT